MAVYLVSNLVGVCFAQAESPAVWEQRFKALKAGVPRLNAEKEIENIRNVKPSYDVWAMDISSLVAYKLDGATVLLVTYKPGIPAAHVSGGLGGHPPVDGEVIDQKILPLR